MAENLPGRITDPKALRALSHPTRWKLIELLGLEPTATATRCAEFTGESVASCSYHLGILAKYGFVEPADGDHGREKPWRSTTRRMSVSGVGLDPEAAMAAETVTEVFLDHEFGRQKEFLRRLDRESPQWEETTGFSTRTVHLTHDELAAVRADIEAVLERFVERAEDPALRPAGSRPVRMMVTAYLPLPPGNPDAPHDDQSENDPTHDERQEAT